MKIFWGCRSFLFPYKPDGEHFKWYGRANIGVSTLNLPDIALSSKGNIEEFWKIFRVYMVLDTPIDFS